MNKRAILTVYLAFALLTLGLLADQETNEKKTLSIGEKVTKLFDQWNNPSSPGAAVAVIKDGMVIYRNGFGSAHLEYNIPITPSTIFHVASVSKQFTAFAITLLEDQGRLSADDDIRKYLPWMPDFGQKITIRHLLNHTSGIRDQWELMILSGSRMEDVLTQQDILYLLKRQQDLNFKPGEQYMYCNSGFTLLTEIVTKVTGEPFVKWIGKNIFNPLGMDSSHFHLDHQQIVKNRAYSYRQDKKRGLVKSILSYANVGATSLFTTVEDMANWMRNYSEKRVGNDKVMARMVEVGVLNNGEKIGYARGLGVGRYKGLKQIGHGGADAGFRTVMQYFPEEKFGVVVLSNLAQFNPGRLAAQITDLYLADKIKQGEAQTPGVKRKVIKLSKKKLQAFTGPFWLTSSRLLRRLMMEGKGLFYVRSSENKSELIPYSPTSFFMKDAPNVTVEFSELKEGKWQKAKVTVGTQVIESKRVEVFNPTIDELKQYSGIYESPELEVRYKLILRKKGIYLEYKKKDNDEKEECLDPLIKDTFGTAGGFATFSFKRDDEGKIVGFTIDTGRVRHLKFTKVK